MQSSLIAKHTQEAPSGSIALHQSSDLSHTPTGGDHQRLPVMKRGLLYYQAIPLDQPEMALFFIRHQRIQSHCASSDHHESLDQLISLPHVSMSAESRACSL